MTQENKQKLRELFQSPGFLEKFSSVKGKQEAIDLVADYGVEITEKDLEDIAAAIEKAINIIDGKEVVPDDDILSEEELDTVAGGTVPPQVIVAGIQIALPFVKKGIQALSKLFKKKKKKKAAPAPAVVVQPITTPPQA